MDYNVHKGEVRYGYSPCPMFSGYGGRESYKSAATSVELSLRESIDNCEIAIIRGATRILQRARVPGQGGESKTFGELCKKIDSFIVSLGDSRQFHQRTLMTRDKLETVKEQAARSSHGVGSPYKHKLAFRNGGATTFFEAPSSVTNLVPSFKEHCVMFLPYAGVPFEELTRRDASDAVFRISRILIEAYVSCYQPTTPSHDTLLENVVCISTDASPDGNDSIVIPFASLEQWADMDPGEKTLRVTCTPCETYTTSILAPYAVISVSKDCTDLGWLASYQVGELVSSRPRDPRPTPDTFLNDYGLIAPKSYQCLSLDDKWLFIPKSRNGNSHIARLFRSLLQVEEVRYSRLVQPPSSRILFRTELTGACVTEFFNSTAQMAPEIAPTWSHVADMMFDVPGSLETAAVCIFHMIEHDTNYNGILRILMSSSRSFDDIYVDVFGNRPRSSGIVPDVIALMNKFIQVDRSYKEVRYTIFPMIKVLLFVILRADTLARTVENATFAMCMIKFLFVVKPRNYKLRPLAYEPVRSNADYPPVEGSVRDILFVHDESYGIVTNYRARLESLLLAVKRKTLPPRCVVFAQ